MNKLLYIFFIILVTTSCSLKPIDNYHGVAFLEKKQEELFKLGKEITISSNVLVLEIDKKGLLKNKKFYNIDDQNKIIFSDDKTLMSDKDSFVYGVISSLKQKIDNPKRNK